MRIRFLFATAMMFALGSHVFAQTQTQDEQLALYYFNNGETDKAATLYEKLYDKYPAFGNYYQQYYKTLVALKRYDDAVKVARKQQKKSGDLTIYVDLGHAYALNDDRKNAQQAYDDALKHLTPDYAALQKLANAFVTVNENDRALQVYEQARKLLNDNAAFTDEIAALYAQRNDAAGFVKTYLELVDAQPNSLAQVEARMQDHVTDEAFGKELQTQLYKAVQKQPDNLNYAQLIIWYYTQKKDFDNALVQAKAVDRRNHEDGTRIFQLAQAAFEVGNYNVANDAYQYIIDAKGKSNLYILCRTEQLNVLKTQLAVEKIPAPEQLTNADAKYKQFLDELGSNAATMKVVRDYAMLQARYLHRPDSAIAMLERIIRIPGADRKAVAQCKLDLGDYYLIAGNVWDAQLVYTQVDKDFEDEPLGEEARLRNAKLSYYKSEFQWTQAQLDIIKGATSELVSNDAIALSVFITDNMGLDSNTVPLSMYARAELLAFQSKPHEALQTLDSLLRQFPKHELVDDALFEKAVINIQLKNFSEAVAYLDTVEEQHSTDLLADDALFMLADLYEHELNNKDKAMELYKDIITKYPGSLFVVEARKRFRTLRGDAM